MKSKSGDGGCPIQAGKLLESSHTDRLKGHVTLESLTDELIVCIAKCLRREAFLNLRAACRRLRFIFYRACVQDPLLRCVEYPSRHIGDFDDDLEIEFKGYWSLHGSHRQKNFFFSDTYFLQTFEEEDTPDSSHDHVSCLFVHFSARRGRVLEKLDSIQRLRSLFSLISGFWNLRTLALSKFDIFSGMLAQLSELKNLHTLSLSNFAYRSRGSDLFGSDPFYSLDFRDIASLEKIYIAPAPILDREFLCLLPSGLQEIEVSLPDSRRDNEFVLDAGKCRTLRVM
jgi:hypothetical protein